MNGYITSLLITGFFAANAVGVVGASWTLTEGKNSDWPGQEVLIALDGKPVARFIHGEGQFKPFLHVYGEEGELLTNGGIDVNGKPAGKFPHHRGIFIGWNQISSELGGFEAGTKPFDLWHFNNGGRMEVLKFAKLDGGKDAATLVAQIAWRAGQEDAQGSNLLLTETRTLRISQPAGQGTRVDAHFTLKPARELNLGGDLQHAGIHFRACNEVDQRAKETSYLWEPDLPGKDGKVASREMKWCRLLFPIGMNWYSATELNTSGNPTDEVSWRDYGRFGFFFKKRLQSGEALDLDYRFFIERVEAPANQAKLSPEQATKARSQAQSRHEEFAKSLRP